MIISITGYSCKKDFNNLDTIDLTKFTFGGKKVIMSKNELLSIYGEPHSISDPCSSKGGKKLAECWNYSTRDFDLYFQVHSDSAFIRTIVFVPEYDTDHELKSSEITLSKRTTLKDIKKMFPNSYRVRNEKFLNTKSELDRFDIIKLKDGTSQERRVTPTEVNLFFLSKKLYRIRYLYNPRRPKKDWNEKSEKAKETFKKVRNNQ